MRATSLPGRNAVRFGLARREAARLAAAQAAAHLLSDRAWAHFERGRGGALSVTLTLKRPAAGPELAALAALFTRLLDDQELRGRLRAASRDVLEYVVSRALVPAAARSGPAAPEPELSAEQQAEIDRLIKEAEDEIQALRRGGAAEDPEGIRKTWEERHGR